MKIQLSYTNKKVSYCIITLCSYGDYGDYEAFPTVPLNLNSKLLAGSLQSTCGDSLRFNKSRLVAKFMQADITVFESGRMILENISPDSQKAAGIVIQALLAAYDSYLSVSRSGD